MVVSGHTHRFLQLPHRQPPRHERVVVRTDVHAHHPGGAAPTGRIVTAEAANEIVTRDVARDAAVATVVAKYAKLVARVAGEVVGSVTGD